MASVSGVVGNLSPAGQALGLGANPVETEEERKRRLQALQAAQSGMADRIAAGYGSALSPAGSALGLGRA